MSPFLLKEGITGSCCNGNRHGFGSTIIGERIISEGKEFKLELEPESEPGLGIVTWEVLLIRMINKTYYENLMLLSSNDITCTGGRIDTFWEWDAMD